MFGISIFITLPLLPLSIGAIMLPMQSSISTINLNSIRVKTKKSFQPAPVIRPNIDRISLTDEQCEEFNIIVKNYNSGSITMEEAILQLRGGNLYDNLELLL